MTASEFTSNRPAGPVNARNNTEEIGMSKRKNIANVEVKRGGGRVLIVLAVLVVGGFFGVQFISEFLQAHAPDPTAAGDVSIGMWVVAGVLALFLAWCFSGSKGGSR